MRAVVYDKKNKRLKLIETEVPAPKPGEVLVRVSAVGICGSDTEMVNADTVADGFTMGHEVAGIVEALGDGVTSVSVSDRVTPRPVGCGECPVCLMGNTHLCLKKISIGTGYLRIVGPSLVFFAIFFVSNGVINGAGQTMVTLVFSIISLWAIRVPVASFLSSTSLGITGIWYGFSASFIIMMLVSLVYYRSGRWQKSVIKSESTGHR